MSVLSLLFNINLFLLALDHLVTGGSAFFYPKRAILMYKVIFGVEVPPQEEYLAIIKPWGALGVFAGLVGLLPIFDPVRYKAVLSGLLMLLLMRIFIRLSNAKRAERHFRLSLKRNIFHVCLIAISAFMIGCQILVSG